jgi:hypothetical protein
MPAVTSSASRERQGVIPEFNCGAERNPAAVALTQTTDMECQRDRGCSGPGPRISKAVDLLERQACNCVRKIQCLRCELLELLRAA